MNRQAYFFVFCFISIGSILSAGFFSPEEIAAFGLTPDMLPKEQAAPQKTLPTPRTQPVRGAIIKQKRVITTSKTTQPATQKTSQPQVKKTLIRIKAQDKDRLEKWIRFYTRKLNLYKRWAEQAKTETQLQRYTAKIEKTKNIIQQLEAQLE